MLAGAEQKWQAAGQPDEQEKKGLPVKSNLAKRRLCKDHEEAGDCNRDGHFSGPPFDQIPVGVPGRPFAFQACHDLCLPKAFPKIQTLGEEMKSCRYHHCENGQCQQGAEGGP